MSVLGVAADARGASAAKDVAAGVSLVAAFAIFLHVAWRYSDGDMIWLQFVGQSILSGHGIPSVLSGTFTADGAPWVPHDWFLGLLLAISHRLLPAVAVSAAAALALYLVALRALRRGTSAFALACVLVWTAASLAGAFGIRGQDLAWPFLAALMLTLDEENPRPLWIFLLIAGWANVHASAVAGAVIAAIVAAAKRKPAVAFAAVLALFCTPLFWRLPAYAFATQFDANLSHTYIAEWHHPTPAVMQFTWGLMPLLALAGYGILRRKRWADIAPALAVTIAALSSIRHIPLCAIVVAPISAEGLATLLADAAGRARSVVAVLATCIVLLTASKMLPYAIKPRGVPIPVQAIASLSAAPGGHHLLCENFAWCSAALRTPNVRDFLDGRADPFPRRVWLDFRTITTMQRGWKTLAARDGIDAFLTWSRSPLSRALAEDAHWRLAYAGEHYAMYVKR